MDRSLVRALKKWDQLLALRQHAEARAPLPWRERLATGLRYHQSRWEVATRLSEDFQPRQAVEDAQLAPSAIQVLDETRLQAVEEGLHHEDDRVSVTVFVPLAFWDDADPTTPLPLRRPRQDPAGYHAFMEALGQAMRPFEDRLKEASQALRSPLRCRPRSILGLRELQEHGWPVRRPFGNWGVQDRQARALSLQRDWLKVGLLAMELEASSPPHLDLLQDLLRDYLRETHGAFNTAERQVGLPLRREAAQDEAEMLRYESSVLRLLGLSQLGRGDVSFLVHHRPDAPLRVDMEIKLTLTDPADPDQPQIHLHQLSQVVRSPAELTRLQAPWVSPLAHRVVSHWSTILEQALG